MPSIEILCIGDGSADRAGDWPFAVARSENRQSHRIPSRFQPDFDRHEGVLYHLGNPNLKVDRNKRFFFAYELLSEECQDSATFLEFDPQYRLDVKAFLKELLLNSTAGQLIFTTDWQFGPDWTKRETMLSFAEFWQRHDAHQLWLNALYPIVGG
jgi:hypothetical protein